MAKSAKQSKPVEFESAMSELQTLVERMEQGDLSLEDSIRQFEQGMKLAAQCQQALAVAEQKVQVLTGESGEERLADLDPDDAANA